MVKEHIVIDLKHGAIEMVSKEDYLKVVEENKKLKFDLGDKQTRLNVITRKCDKLEKEKEELKETLRVCKDDVSRHYHNSRYYEVELDKAININVDLAFENKGLKVNNEVLVKIIEEQRIENEKLYYENKKHIEDKKVISEKLKIIESGVNNLEQRLIEVGIHVPEKEEYFTLRYTYKHEHSGEIKEYVQQNLLEDEIAEMFGMDSQNWIEFSKVKQDGLIEEEEEEECGCSCCYCECGEGE